MRAVTWGLAACLIAPTLQAEDDSKDKLVTEALINSAIEGIGNHTALVSRVSIPAYTVLPRHSHPTEEFLYVIEGGTILKIDGAAEQILLAGSAVTIPAKTVHTALTRSQGAEVIIFRVQPKGQPVRILAPTPVPTNKD